MGLRNILGIDDKSLRKQSREVTDFNARLHSLLDDMRETLENAHGLGLAAPQVGVLRRAVLVVDTSGEDDKIIELINPVIVEKKDSQEGAEGCLSMPNVWGLVQRPNYVKVLANDRFGNSFVAEGEGLTARAFCHEIDHLNGVLFMDISERMLDADEIEEMLREREAGNSTGESEVV